MRMAIRLVLLGLLGLLAATVASGAEATATIQIDASRHGPRLNPRMYGIFLEEINHGVDGGLYVGGWGNRDHGIEFNRTPVGRRVAGRIEPNRWYDIKIELSGQRIRCYLDGKLIHDEATRGTQRFLATAGRDESGDLVLKAINTSADPVATTLGLSGLDRIAPEGEITVLRSDRLDDNNTLDQPTKVVPSTGRITIRRTANGRFSHEFPPFSLTVMRLKAQ